MPFCYSEIKSKQPCGGAKRTLIEFDNIWPKKESTSAIKMKEREGKEGENKIILIVFIVIVSNFFKQNGVEYFHIIIPMLLPFYF